MAAREDLITRATFFTAAEVNGQIHPSREAGEQPFNDANTPSTNLEDCLQASEDQSESPDSDLLAELLGNLMGKP